MTSNPHVQNIENGLDDLKEWTQTERIEAGIAMTLALQAESALATAFEQRTATLIAYMQANPASLVEGIDVTVRERLGLPPDPVFTRPLAEPSYTVDSPNPRCTKLVAEGRSKGEVCWLAAGHDGGCK